MAEDLSVDDVVIWKSKLGRMLAGTVIGISGDGVTVEVDFCRDLPVDSTARYTVAQASCFRRIDLSRPEDLETWLTAL